MFDPYFILLNPPSPAQPSKQARMDDFVMVNLTESKNEWCHRLVSVLTPLVIEGFRSIFNEAWNLCVQNNETNKYLMTFQNLLSGIPKWNSLIVEEERKRIIERSQCNFLEDLITCVHIIQLKVLTCIRVGNKQKKIEISVPKLDHFIHKVYVNAARKVYVNVYLFEKNVDSLIMQKNNRELELIVQETIMVSIRESIPTEAIIRAYMDESIEEEEIVSIEPIAPPPGDNSTTTSDVVAASTAADASATTATTDSSSSGEATKIPSIRDLNDDTVVTKTKLSFSKMDEVLLGDNSIQKVDAADPKSSSSNKSSSSSLLADFSLLDTSTDSTILLPVEDLDGPSSSSSSSSPKSSSASIISLDDLIEEL